MNDAVHTTPPVGPLLARIGHLALMTPDLARLTDFYVTIFGAAVTESTGNPAWKCIIDIAPGTALHLYEVPVSSARRHDDLQFDAGSINHFALEAASPNAFLAIRAGLMAGGYADEAVVAAPHGYSLNAVDPDGLYLEVTLARVEDWEPPFRTTAFLPMPG